MMATILQTFNQYFVRVHEDNSWDEIYNPHEATVFNRKDEALTWAKNETNLTRYITAISGKNIQKARDEFDEWIKNGMVRRHFESLNSTFNVLYDPEKHSAMDILKWHYQSALQGDDFMIQYEVYESWGELWEHFDFIHGFQAFHDNISLSVLDYTKTYISFEISVSRQAKWENFKKEMDLILDNFEFDHPDEDDGLIISIFEHDLCETRNMALLMNDREKDEWSVYDSRGFCSYDLQKEPLRKCFELIRSKYWYD